MAVAGSLLEVETVYCQENRRGWLIHKTGGISVNVSLVELCLPLAQAKADWGAAMLDLRTDVVFRRRIQAVYLPRIQQTRFYCFFFAHFKHVSVPGARCSTQHSDSHASPQSDTAGDGNTTGPGDRRNRNNHEC